MSSLLNKLAFNGYRVWLISNEQKQYSYTFNTIDQVNWLTENSKKFPSAAEAALLTANLERAQGMMCAPFSVEDLEGNQLWFNEGLNV